MILSLLTVNKIRRTRQGNTVPSYVCEPLDLKSLCQHFTSTRRASVSILWSGRGRERCCHRPRFCTPCSALKHRTRAMPALLRRVGYMVNPLSPKASVAVLNNFAAAGLSKFQMVSAKFRHIGGCNIMLTHEKQLWSMKTHPSRTPAPARSRSNIMGEVAQAMGRDPSSSIPATLTGACSLFSQ